MPQSSNRRAIAFSCVAHFYQHVLAALFLTVVLVLEREWDLPYDTLIALWTPGALMLGLGAPLAGWLSDRWGEARLMIIFFVGTGLATSLCGLAQSPLQMAIGLTLVGLFGSIDHPVAMSWAIKNAVGRGKVIGIVGVFGSLGFAVSAVIAGGLSDLLSWRAAFIVPGAVSMLTGGLLLRALVSGRVADRKDDLNPQPEAPRGDMLRAVVALTVAMLIFSLVYSAFAAALPKWLSLGLGDRLGEGILGIGALVTGIYLIGGAAQLVGGPLADRWSVKGVYAVSFLIKLPAFAIAAQLDGWSMVLAALVIVFMVDIGAPAENVLIARYSPSRHRGLAYGIRHIAGFVTAPLGVQLVALFYGWFGGFAWLFAALSGLVAMALFATFFLPADRPAKPGASRSTAA
jgi:MFS family permease